MSFQNLYVEILILKTMSLWGEVLKRYLGHESEALMNEV